MIVILKTEKQTDKLGKREKLIIYHMAKYSECFKPANLLQHRKRCHITHLKKPAAIKTPKEAIRSDKREGGNGDKAVGEGQWTSVVYQVKREMRRSNERPVQARRII